MEDRRCNLGLAGRLELVKLVEEGATVRAVAAAFDVAPATAHRWWHRWQAASEAERASRACLRTGRPVPASCPPGRSRGSRTRDPEGAGAHEPGLSDLPCEVGVIDQAGRPGGGSERTP
jgi:transposase-like protein